MPLNENYLLIKFGDKMSDIWTIKCTAGPGRMAKNMIEELDITVTDAAAHLKVTRQTLNHLINHENSRVSPELALRLEAVFGSTADNWLRMQAAYDMARIRCREAEITKGLNGLQPE